MATVTHEVTTADTGASPNTSGAFTPALNDLLVVIVQAAGTTDSGPTLTSSIGGFTFTLVNQFDFNGSTGKVYLFVSNALVSSATSQTVTADTPGDPFTGSVITVFAIAGITRVGTNAIRQSAGESNQSAVGIPEAVFPIAALTDNPTVGAVVNLSNPAGVLEPIGWTEASDVGYNSPTAGMETVFRNSGFTGTTITWGDFSVTAFGDIIAEIDSSAVGDPFFTQLDAAYI